MYHIITPLTHKERLYPMNILAFAASNSDSSMNRKLVTHAGDLIKQHLFAHATIIPLDINDYEMPIYSPMRERADGIPALAQAFFAAIGAADAILISFAEHNGGLSAAYKNLFDWTSRIDAKVYQGKKCVFMATSPGGRGGQGVLNGAKASAPHFGADLVGDFSLAKFYDAFDADNGRLRESADTARLLEALSGLK